jgi:hypothetical protein
MLTTENKDYDEINFTNRKPSDGDHKSQEHMSSSHVDDCQSVSNYHPATLEIINPLIPREEERLGLKQSKLGENSHDNKPTRINLKTSMQGNFNYSIVILGKTPNIDTCVNSKKNFNLSARKDEGSLQHINYSKSNTFRESGHHEMPELVSNSLINPSPFEVKPRNLSIHISHLKNETIAKKQDSKHEVVFHQENEEEDKTQALINRQEEIIQSQVEELRPSAAESEKLINRGTETSFHGVENTDHNIKIEGVRDFNFNFDNQIRRYKRKDLLKAKNFFKYRYISEKLIEQLHLLELKNKEKEVNSYNYRNYHSNSSSNLNNVILNNQNSNLLQVNAANQFSTNNLNTNVSLSNNLASQNYTNFNHVITGEKDIVFSSEDKNVIKFTSLFLQKIEKAIFLFNMKKYNESFLYLHQERIIKNEEEFGEILLIYPGFDKFIIGEFLSKDKAPNIKSLVLNFFMNKMDFCEEYFLMSFRYLLSRLNLPKDSSLILNIIDVFSSVYLNDNKKSGLFKDNTAVYLLCSTVLALNTMFHCKIPGANIRVIKKEDFIKMNENVDFKLTSEIYEEIKERKLDIIYDYNEQMYKKLEFEDINKTLRKEITLSIVNSCKSDYLNTEKTPVNCEDLINMLKAGQTFLKYGKKGEPHLRFVYLSKNEESLNWKPLTCCFNSDRSLKTKSLINVYIGTSNSDVFSKNKVPPEFELNCFSILGEKRTLDLKHEDIKVTREWFKAVKYLIKRAVSKYEIKKKKLKELSNRKEIISDFWRTEIIPKWNLYRNFLLKDQEENNINENNKSRGKSNKKDIKVVNNEQRKSIKSVLSTGQPKIVINEKDRQEVAYLWFLGIPSWLRKNMWTLIISNNLNINENLFNFFLQKIESIEFNGDDVTERRMSFKMGDENEGGGIKYCETNFNENENSTCHNDDPLFYEIVHDVRKCYQKYGEFAVNLNIEEKKFKEDLFKLIRIFTNYRPDITYSRPLAYISTIFYMNSEDYYQTFVLIANFIIPSFFSKFLNRDEIFVKSRLEFFEMLMGKYNPQIYIHFKKMDINTRLFFYEWVDYLFTK